MSCLNNDLTIDFQEMNRASMSIQRRSRSRSATTGSERNRSVVRDQVIGIAMPMVRSLKTTFLTRH